jgi:CRP/FNR family transcriptional regulator
MPLARNDAHVNNRGSWTALESVPLFTGVSQEDFRKISAAARLKRFARGEMLYLEGDTVEQVLLVISGSVKIAQLAPKGMEVVLRLGTPGDIFDVESLFSTGKQRMQAQAVRDCRALIWDAAHSRL